ncbi:MAG: DUF3798 domain-containing protein, partial [Synergistaceae bacterium]|nr:DUF3798 domain-containing protein [Synergistaceae bacterium]
MKNFKHFFRFFPVFISALASLAFSVPVFADGAGFHVGIMTGSASRNENGLLGARVVVEEYGSVSRGGAIEHLIHPNDFVSEMETTIDRLSQLADDPKMKVVVVNQAVPGTAEGFRRIRERRPDMVLLAGSPHEAADVVAAEADLVVNIDTVARGYLLVHTARELGAKVFVHLSFARHMSYETVSRFHAVLKAACEDLGLAFAAETVPDPASDVGASAAQQYVLERFPAWLDQYGQETAFF